MKSKLLRILLIAIPLAITPLIVKSCSNSWNLSTWGNKKAQIVKDVFAAANKDQIGDIPWNLKGFPTLPLFIYYVNSAFVDKLNFHANLTKKPINISWGYANNEPDNNAPIKNILQKGILLSFTGIDGGFSGKIDINFQGSVT